jgi:hypothetical protein
MDKQRKILEEIAIEREKLKNMREEDIKIINFTNLYNTSTDKNKKADNFTNKNTQ